MSKPIRCISLDVEEYFQIEAAHATIRRDRWCQWPSRIEANMDRLLGLFDEMGCRATLFILGHIAELHPKLIRRCADAGHEIASHGSWHDRLHRMSPGSFADDLQNSRKLLEDLTGQRIRGYRAPTWSVTRETSWAIDVLVEQGFDYDASIYPVSHPQYGVPHAPDRPFFVRNTCQGSTLLELPPLTWRTMGRNIPVAGGGYFRVLPLALMKRGMKQAENENRPAILYFHPWEFDPDMPRLPLSLVGRLRTYTGLRTSFKRLEQILRFGGTWRTISDCVNDCSEIARQGEVFTLQHQTAA